MKKHLFLFVALLWGVISLQAQFCVPPTNLQATAHNPEWRNVNLTWTAAADATQQTLGYGTTNSSSLSVGGDFVAIIRLTSSELANYATRYLSAVQFKPGMSQSDCDYHIMVWQGGSVGQTNDDINPGTMLCNQFVSQQLETGVLNTVMLDTAVAIDLTQELWIGVHAERLVPAGFPIGASYNPSVDYKGNLLYEGQSFRLLNLPSQPNNTNWYIFAVLTESDHLLTGYNVYRDNVLLTTTSSASYIDNLDVDGVYAYQVKAQYANGCESSGITASVTMNDDCFINTFPYTENFDGVTGTTLSTLAGHVLPDCWGWVNRGASYPGYPVVYNSSTYSSSGVNSLRFYTYNTSADNTTYADQYAILPPIDLMVQPVNALQLEFDARGWSTTNTYQLFLEVGVMTSLSDVSTFVPVDTIQCTGTTYGSYVVNFSSYEGNGQYIALRAPKLNTGGTVYNSGVVDNLVLDVIPTCPKPSDLAVNNALTTDNSITMSWTENGGAINWEIEYGPAGFTPGYGTVLSTTDNPVEITGLSPAMPYNFYVRSVCAPGDTSRYSSVLMASTSCGALNSLPYVQNFDSYTGATSGTTSNIEQSCWSQISNGTISSYAGYPIIYNSSTYAHSGTNALRFYTYTASTYGDEYAVMPAVDVTIYPMSTLQVEFMASRYSTYPFTMIVGVMDGTASESSFVPVDTIEIPTTAPANEFGTYIVSFENYVGNGSRVAFKAVKPTANYNVGFLDDVTLSTIPNCKKPIDVVATNISYDKVVIDWTPFGDETNWDVVLVPAGAPAESGNLEYASEHPYTIENLTENTSYDVYVRANCGGDVSPWANVYNFRTRCNPVTTLPFEEHFDSNPAATAVSSGVIPSCWERETNYSSSYPYIYGTYQASGTGSLYFYSTSAYYSRAISPALDLSQYTAGDLALSFKALKTSAAYGDLEVFMATNPSDESTFILLKSLNSSDYEATTTWTEFSVVLNQTYDEPVYLIFNAPANVTSYVCVDDIVLDETPECSSPRSAYVSDIYGVHAQVNWTEAFYGAESYTVEYTEYNANNWTSAGTTTGTSLLLTDLDPLTRYEVRITSNCTSGSADPVNVNLQTLCLIPDDVTIGTGTNTSYYVPFYGAYKYSFSQQLYTAAEMQNEEKDINTISFQYTGDQALTRMIDVYLLHTTESSLASSWIPMTNAKLVYSGEFTVTATANNDNWCTIVLDSTFHYDGISNLLIAVNNRSTVSAGSAATTKTFKTTSATGKGRYVYGASTVTVPYNPFDLSVAGTSYAYHNNIKFGSCDNSTTCAAPLLMIDEMTDNAATLSWVPGYQETSWELEYRAQSDASWSSEGVVTTSPYLIEGLNTNTMYEFRLRALCSDTSDWATASARTFCTSVDVPYTQDFESAPGSGAGNFIECWTRGTTSTTAYPYTNSSQSNSGTYALYFYGTTSYYSYAATPRFDESVQMDSLQIRFWARKTSAAYNIQVGIMTNPYDYNTFELLATLSPDETSTWQELQVNTSAYQGAGRFVAFRIPSQATSAMYIDDILIQHIPSCPRVQDVVAENVTANQADVTWSVGSEASSWYYTYGLKDSVEFDIATATMISENTITLQNLVGNTEYDVMIMSVCDNGEEAEVVKFTFRTLCDPISTLPYRESFDTYGGSGAAYYPSCWYRQYVTPTAVTEAYPYVYSTYSNSTPSCLYLYGLTSTPSYSVAVMQPFADNIDLNVLQLDFTLRTATLSNYILVGVMTNPNDLSSFTVIDTAYCTTTGTFEPKSIALTSYTGTGKYIAFKSWGSMYMDDIVVDYVPSCDNPTNLVISDIALDAATITWIAGDAETSWEVYVVPSGSPIVDVQPVVVTNNTYDINNLNSSTAYDVYVRAICPDFGHSGYLVGSFVTNCEGIATLPFTENFDTYSGATTGTVNNLPMCWKFINHGTLSSYVGYPIIYANSSYAASGTNSLRFYVYSASTYSTQYAVLPEFNTSVIPLNTLAVEFDIRKYSASYESFVLEVGVMTDPTNDSTFVPVDTVTVTSTDYSRQIAYLNRYEGTGTFIALRAVQPSTSYNAGHIDNLVVDLMPSCLRVNDLAVTSVNNTSIGVTWQPSGDEQAWLVNYKLANDTTWQTEVATSTSYVLSGLAANTAYDIQVIADCGSSLSAPSNAITVTTDCEDMFTIPYTENFDNYTATTSGSVVNLPTCWHQMNLGCSSSSYTAYPIMYNGASYAFSGTNSLRFYTYNSGSSNYGDQWVVMRGLDTNVVPIQNLQLKLKARKYSASYPFNLTIGVMSDYVDTSTFVPVATISPEDVTYEDFTVYFRAYQGGGKYIVMRAALPNSSYNAGNVDNIELSLAPTCLPVQNLSASGITANSIDIAWDALGDESVWNVYYRAANDTTWNIDQAVGTPTYTLSNLQPSTTYLFRVQPDCGGESAPFSTVLAVSTECVAIDQLPYTENFDSYVGTTYSVAGPKPNCWETFTDNSARPAPHIVGSGSYWYPQSQPNALSFVGGSPSTNAVAVLPNFVSPLNTLQVSFAYRMESATTGTLKVGYVTDVTNMVGSFVEVATIGNSTTISNDTIDFSAVPDNGRIAFLWNYVGSSFYSCNIDDVEVSELPAPLCEAPTAITASNIMQTTATVGWTAGGDETEWNIQYKQAASSDWSASILVSGTPTHTLTGLMANTLYQVRVQAVCGTSSVSDWTTAVFTTLDETVEVCPAPTNLAATDVRNEEIDLTWNQEANTANSWDVKYRVQGSSNWSTATANAVPFTLTGLTGLTSYEIQVVAHCTNGLTSDPSNTITVTTHNVGVNDYDLNNVNVYPNPTSGQLTIDNAEMMINRVEVYDVYGKLMNAVEVNDVQTTMNVSSYAAGTYFVRIYGESGMVTKRIVKR